MNEEAELFARYMRESPFRQHASRFHFFRDADVKTFYESGLGFDKCCCEWGVTLASHS